MNVFYSMQRDAFLPCHNRHPCCDYLVTKLYRIINLNEWEVEKMLSEIAHAHRVTNNHNIFV